MANGFGDRCEYLGRNGNFNNGGSNNNNGNFNNGGGGFDDWTQGCAGLTPRGNNKQCGSRSFRHAPNRARGEASPEEFPWTCLILDGDNNFVGTCAIIPDNFDNDIRRGTRKVITAAHKLEKVQAAT